MSYIKNIILLLLGIGLPVCAFAQSFGNEQEAMQDILYRAVVRNVSVEECEIIDVSFSIISISFNWRGRVAKVKTLNLHPCLEVIKDKIKKAITENCNKLPFQTKEFRNKYVLVLLLFSEIDEAHFSNVLSRRWMAMVRSKSKLSDGRKELKYVIPLACGHATME